MPAVNKGQVVQLFYEGLRQVEIAAKVGVSKQRIWQILKASRGLCETCGLREVYCKCAPLQRNWVKWKPGGRGRMPLEVRGNFTFSGCYRD